MIDLKVKDLGLLDYEDVWQSMVSAIDNRPQHVPDEVWFVQHLPVYTLGYAGSEKNIINKFAIGKVNRNLKLIPNY